MKCKIFISFTMAALFLTCSTSSFLSGRLSAQSSTTNNDSSSPSTQRQRTDSPSLKRSSPSRKVEKPPILESSPSRKVEKPPTLKLTARGGKVFLELSKKVNKIEIRVLGKKMGTLRKGSSFDISAFLKKSGADRFEFRLPNVKDKKGKPYSKTLSVAGFRATPAKKPKAIRETEPVVIPTQISIQNVYLKDNRILVKVKKSGTHKFGSQELIAGQLAIDYQDRKVSIPLVKLCTPAQLNLGRAIVLDTGLMLSEKSRVTVGFKRIASGRPRTMTLKPLKSLAPSTQTATMRQPGEPAPPLPGPDPEREPRDSGHPDLVVELSLDLPEQQGHWGSPTARIKVTNIGDQATSAETTVNLWLTDHPVTYYGRMVLPFWSKMIPVLGPNMDHTITQAFNITETWTLPGTQTTHTILPGTFRLLASLNRELLAEGEEVGDGANEDEVIFDYSGENGFYDLAMLDAKLTHNNRLLLHLRNNGETISSEKYEQMYAAVSIDGGSFKRIKLLTVDPEGTLRKGALGTSPAASHLRFVWPSPAKAGSDGLWPFETGARHQVTARVGRPGYNNIVHFANDAHPGNNERIQYVGGLPDLVVCFKKYNESPVHASSTYPVKISNIGNKASPKSKLRFWIDNKGVKTYDIRELLPGEEISIQRKVYWASRRTSNFTLIIDHTDSIDEVYDNNNSIAGKICTQHYCYGNSETLCSDAPGMADPP